MKNIISIFNKHSTNIITGITSLSNRSLFCCLPFTRRYFLLFTFYFLLFTAVTHASTMSGNGKEIVATAFVSAGPGITNGLINGITTLAQSFGHPCSLSRLSAGGFELQDGYMSSANEPSNVTVLVSPTNGSYHNSDLHPTLTWTIPQDADGGYLHFKVEVSSVADFTAEIKVAISSANVAGFSPTPPRIHNSGECSYTPQFDLFTSTNYWRIRAWDYEEYGTHFTTYRVIIDTTVPSTPSKPTASPSAQYISTNTIEWSWLNGSDAESGIKKYLFCVGTYPGGTDILDDVDVGNVTNYTKTNLAHGSTYYAKVKAVNMAQLTGLYSPNSDGTYIDLVAPAMITTVSALTGTNQGEIKLSWSAPGNDGIEKNLTGGYCIQYSSYTVEWSTSTKFNIFLSTSEQQVWAENYYTVGGLLQEVTYYFRIWSHDLAGNWSELSNVATAQARADTTCPSPISNLTALTGITDGEIILQWTAPGDDDNIGTVTNYIVKYATFQITTELFSDDKISVYAHNWTSFVTSGEQESRTVTGLNPSTTFYFAIVGIDEHDNYGIWKSSINVEGINTTNYAVACDTYPPPPVNLIVVAGDGKITLSWTAPSAFDIGYYNVYCDSTTPYDLADEYLSTTTASTSVTITGLTNYTTYWYRITTLDTPPLVLESTYYFTISTAPSLSIPTNFSAIVQSSTTIKWLWNDNTDNELGYSVYQSTGGSPIATLPANTNYWVETELTPNTSYSHYVTVFDALGEENSNTTSYYTFSAMPGALPMSDVNISSIAVNWTDGGNPLCTKYNIDCSSIASFNPINESSTTINLQFVICNLQSNTTYYFRVCAENNDGVHTEYMDLGSTVTHCNTPTNLTHSANTLNGIYWNWAKNNSDSTKIYAEDEINNTGWITDMESWNASVGHSPNTQYTLRVKARNYLGVETVAVSTVAYSSIETPTTVGFGEITTNSIRVIPAGSFTNLGSGESAVFTSNKTNGNNSGWGYIIDYWLCSGLLPNTSYTFRSKARNGDGDETSWSTEKTKSTLANIPAIPELLSIHISSISICIANNGNPYWTQYAIKISSCSADKYLQLDNTLGDIQVYQTTTTWTNNIWVKDLILTTTYSIQVAAKNNDGIITDWSQPKITPDSICPAKITDLVASTGTTDNSIKLIWTATGDDENSGTASSYIIRYATYTITEENWNSTISVSNPPVPEIAGTIQSKTIDGFSQWTTFYFAIKVQDDGGNLSDISNIAKTKPSDVSMPATSIIFPVNGRYYTSISSISGSAVDNFSGVDKVELKIHHTSDNTYWNGTNWIGTSVWLSATSTTNWFYDNLPSVLQYGEYVITLRGIDCSGNVETLIVNTTFYITAPVKLQILLPGEISAPGTVSGKSGVPVQQVVGMPFNVIVNCVDENWNVVDNVSDIVGVLLNDPNGSTVPYKQLVHGTTIFDVKWITPSTSITDYRLQITNYKSLSINQRTIKAFNISSQQIVSDTSQPITVIQGPVATVLSVSHTNVAPISIAKGQENVEMLKITFLNPGTTETHNIVVTSLKFTFEDKNNNPIIPTEGISKITIETTQKVHLIETTIPNSGSSVSLDLSEQPIIIPTNQTVTVSVKVSANTITNLSNFKIGVAHQTDIKGADAVTGEEVVVYAANGDLYPIRSSSVILIDADLKSSFGCYPNPFAAGQQNTTIEYFLSDNSYVTIQIWDIVGESVITLVDGDLREKGLNKELWNGLNQAGRVVLNGVYICRITVRTQQNGAKNTALQKIAVVK